MFINERYTVSHTPGPWKTALYRQSPVSPFVAVLADKMTFGYHRDRKERGVVCIVRVGEGRHLDQAESDARVIAAAPDLLAACQRAYECCYDKNSEDGMALKAAISKATKQ